MNRLEVTVYLVGTESCADAAGVLGAPRQSPAREGTSAPRMRAAGSSTLPREGPPAMACTACLGAVLTAGDSAASMGTRGTAPRCVACPAARSQHAVRANGVPPGATGTPWTRKSIRRGSTGARSSASAPSRIDEAMLRGVDLPMLRSWTERTRPCYSSDFQGAVYDGWGVEGAASAREKASRAPRRGTRTERPRHRDRKSVV